MVALKGGKGPHIHGSHGHGGKAPVGGRLASETGETVEDILARGGVSANHPAVRDQMPAKDKIPAAAAPAAPAVTPQPDVTTADRVIGAAGSASNMVAMAAMPIFIAPQLAGQVITDAAELSKAGWLTRNIRQPAARFFNKITTPTIADVGEKIGVNKAVSGVVDPVVNATGNVTEKYLKRPTAFLRNRNVAKATGQHTLLKEQVSKLHAMEMPSELRTHVDALHRELHTADFRHIDASRVKGAVDGFDNAAKQILKVESGPEISGVMKSMGKVAGRTEKLLSSGATVRGLENVGQTIKSAPKKLSSVSAVHGAINGAWIAGSVVSMASDANSFAKQLKILKRMYADMTGKDVAKVSNMEVLVGSAPAPVRAARANLLKFTSISEIADAIGVAINVKGVMGKGFNFITGMIAYQVPQLISSAAGNLLGPNVLGAYDAISKAQKAGQKISAEDYAQMLYIASPELKAKGENNPFLLAVAKQFEQEQASAATVLNAVTNGDVTLRISKLMVENDTKMKAAAIEETPAQPEMSHVEKLEKPAAAKPVHGHFTQQLAASQPAAETAPVR